MNALNQQRQSAPQPFVWGDGGERLSPEQVERRRQIADALMQNARQPVDNVWGSLGSIAQTISGTLLDRRAGEAEATGREGAREAIIRHLSGQTAPAAGGAPMAVGGGMPALPQGGGADTVRAGLVSRGLPEHVADAFILNFQDESGLNPGINEISPIVPGSRGGFGLAQWTGPRRKALESFAAQRGTSVADLDTQLDFLMSELQGPEARAFEAIMSSPDTGSAAAAIVNNFLRPAEEHRTRREASYLGGSPREQVVDGLLSGGQPAPSGGNGDVLTALMELSGDPWVREAHGPVIEALMNQQLAQADPRYQQQLRQGDLDYQRGQFELQQMMNPGPAAPEFHGGQWWDTSGGVPTALTDRAVDPTTAQQNFEYLLSQGVPVEDALERAFSGGVNVNVGQSEFGTIPPGWRNVYDDSGNLTHQEPIEGGPAWQEQQEAARQSNERQSNLDRYGTTVVRNVGRLLDILDENPDWAMGGIIGDIGQHAKGSPQARAAQIMFDIASSTGVQEMQLAREASPTGGLMGNMNAQQTRMMMSLQGMLEAGMDVRDIQENAKFIANNVLDAMHGTPQEIAALVDRARADPAFAQTLADRMGVGNTIEAIEREAASLSRRYELAYDNFGQRITQNPSHTLGGEPQQSGGGDVDDILRGYGL